MTRLSLLGVLAISATLIAAPTASAKPIGLVHTGDAQAHHAAGHAPKPRCAHNGAVRVRSVQNWERTDGEGVVPWRRLDEIAAATGVTKEWLLHGDEVPEQPSQPFPGAHR